MTSGADEMRLVVADLLEDLQPFLRVSEIMGASQLGDTPEALRAAALTLHTGALALTAVGTRINQMAGVYERFSERLAAQAERLGGTEAPPVDS